MGGGIIPKTHHDVEAGIFCHKGIDNLRALPHTVKTVVGLRTNCVRARASVRLCACAVPLLPSSQRKGGRCTK